jgi:hypothetical protein
MLTYSHPGSFMKVKLVHSTFKPYKQIGNIQKENPSYLLFSEIGPLWNMKLGITTVWLQLLKGKEVDYFLE